MKGVYQHCSEKHLERYLNEFSFRYSKTACVSALTMPSAPVAPSMAQTVGGSTIGNLVAGPRKPRITRAQFRALRRLLTLGRMKPPESSRKPKQLVFSFTDDLLT